MNWKRKALTCLFILQFSCCFEMAAETMDLSGRWGFQSDPQDCGIASNFFDQAFPDTIHLPGTISQAGKGNPLTMQPALPPVPPEKLNLKKGLLFGRNQASLTNSPLEHLFQNFSYVGPAWYRREVEIPKNWTNQDVQLFLERAMWETRVWVNGQFIGSRNNLVVPHTYEIGPALKAGRNVIVIRVDNRRQLAIGDPHAYTDQSQTIWNGIVGRIVLEARDKVRIEHLELRPDLEHGGVTVMAQIHNGSGQEVEAALALQASPENFKDKPMPVLSELVSLPPGDSEQKIFYPMGTNFESWSEFSPKLYRMRGTLKDDDDQAEIATTFGMREFKTVGRQFVINGQPTFLRGTVNCCEFPKTGYPDMTGGEWQKIFSIVKACGLNHVRFHTWCPPEIAFELADRMGIYLEVELPDWCFKIGQDTNVTAFFSTEGERMIREYGNHPSWVMLTMGNELKGDYAVLDDLKAHFRALDPELLYDSTTYPSSPGRGKAPEPADDYYISQDTKNGRARGQDIINNTPPGTETNFEQAVSCINVPFISHEVGQYCVYPNLAEIPKYDGVLRAPGFEAIRADLKKKGRLNEATIYTRDSGKLAALLYKEEIERALRTPDQAGFQLLQLNDFPGQGTSTVGLYDAFWDSKGLITPEQFRQFCAPIVPLVMMPKRVYQNDEGFDAGIEIANFGPAAITNATIVWKIFDGKTEVGDGSFKPALIPLGHGSVLGQIRQSFAAVTKPAKLTVTVALKPELNQPCSAWWARRHANACENSWTIWVYPKSEPGVETNGVEIFYSAGKSFYDALSDGKRVLLLPSEESVKSPLAGEFVPVFWNPVMFPNQPGSMGAMIDAGHPVFADFPTGPWTDWQWWELLNHSFAVNLEGIPSKVAMPFRLVDKFNRNALPAAIFEARVGNGRLLVCTLDLTSDLDTRIAARQLRRSIFNYMAGGRFQPHARLIPADLKNLFP